MDRHKIKQIRLDAGLTIPQLAKIASVDQVTIYRLEQGARQLKAWCLGFYIPLDFLNKKKLTTEYVVYRLEN